MLKHRMTVFSQRSWSVSFYTFPHRPFYSLLVQISDGSKSIPVGAIIAITAEEGDDLSPAAIEALLAESSDDAPVPVAPAEVVEQAPPKVEEPLKVEEQKAAPAPTPVKEAAPIERAVILASPLAKRMALDQGIALSKVVGTGPGGRITKADIEAYTPPAPVAAPAPAARAAPVASTSSAPAPSIPAPLASSSSAYTDTPVSSMRKIIASRLSESKSTIPHYYLTTEINMDRVNKLRSVFNGAAKMAESINGGVKDGVKSGVKLSVNDFIVKACASALQDVPEVNSGWHGDFVRRYVLQNPFLTLHTTTDSFNNVDTTSKISRSLSQRQPALSLLSSSTPARLVSLPSPPSPNHSLAKLVMVS